MREMGQIPEVQKSVRMTASFSGYNHRDVIADGEMYDTENLSDDLNPILTNRKLRGIATMPGKDQTEFGDTAEITCVHGGNKLSYIVGAKVFHNHVKQESLRVTATQVLNVAPYKPKMMVKMGAYVCIWPDKLYFNTEDASDFGYMERPWYTDQGNNISAVMCEADGTAIDMTGVTVSSNAPKNPDNGKMWIDSSGDVDVLRKYSSGQKQWVEVATTYVKLTANFGGYHALYTIFTVATGKNGNYGIGGNLNVYDTVNISGLEAANTENARVKKQISELNGEHIVYGVGSDYIIVAGILRKANPTLMEQNVYADRTVPDLDYVCEANNRIWGCKYSAASGNLINEIRACALGDFKNWNKFMGLASDSYVMSIGTEGAWTGCVTQRGVPTFFKEGCIHRVMGLTPSTFQLTTINSSGVQAGSWQSIALLNETVFYKSPTDVVAFDGNMPYSIGENLGNVRYSDARGGVLGSKYYISMKNTDNEWNLFVYNTKTGAWYREDDMRGMSFATVGDEMYFIDETNNKLISVNGTYGTLETGISWRAEFGLSGVEYAPNDYGRMARNEIRGSHYLSRFDIRMNLEQGGQADLEIMYDGDGHWIKMGEIHGAGNGTFVLPVIPRRCDHLRFRIRGTGKFKIYSISRIMEVGSDGGKY